MQFFVLASEALGLLDLVGHARVLGMNGVAWSRGSASDTRVSAMKDTGRSGLSRAARPTLAQYSTWPEMLRCSAVASALAWSYSWWSMRMDVVAFMFFSFATFVVVLF